MNSPDPDPDLAARLNAVPVSAEELLRTAAAIHRLPVEHRSWQARARCAVELFGREGDKAYAVTARLEALRQLVDAGGLPEDFAPTAASGARLLAEPVFEAAAREPLVCAGAVCSFARDRFVAAALSYARLEGDEG